MADKVLVDGQELQPTSVGLGLQVSCEHRWNAPQKLRLDSSGGYPYTVRTREVLIQTCAGCGVAREV